MDISDLTDNAKFSGLGGVTPLVKTIRLTQEQCAALAEIIHNVNNNAEPLMMTAFIVNVDNPDGSRDYWVQFQLMPVKMLKLIADIMNEAVDPSPVSGWN